MINYAIAFFSITAILGLILLTFILKDKPTPKGVAFVHGPIGAVGVILLFVYTYGHGPELIESIVLFCIAIILGLVMFIRDITGRKVPKWLGILHGLIAVAGFIFLLIFAFK